MDITRRAAIGAALTASVASRARAQSEWPNRSVRLIVPFPPGGGTDLLARILAQHLQSRLGQPFVVENRSGGGGLLATELVTRAAPDGYTLAVNSSGPLTILPQLTSVPYDPMADFVHIALPAITPLLLVVAPNSRFRSFNDLLHRARRQPGGLNACTGGQGSPSHLIVEMLTRAFQLDMVQIPYRGSGPALTEAIAGNCDLLFDSGTSSLPFIRQGTLRALAVSGSARLAALPDVPTVAEQGAPGFEASAWSALFAPAGTPPPIVARLNQEVRALMATPAQQERLANSGSIPMDLSPEAFTAFLQRERASWGEIIRSANIRL
ncbi:Bug family tripartite tricarboxylate transporter substrate binding protein [Plastoroseomonas hellenica]|uniref:Bug family tripartite tricarboxylate transporter substrate binding protein n=1 Tax=Plastoroseomonas hellenica TaxID=2687306 RepID=UPI001BA9C214|nr:tripartite tricarboxylate transporter substrate binding protein [Plastoroseomonas hellenica]MBR0647266.1 tripartite tricarboxylate transporter substrate binding protein [Plastoroseomonas hellenica]